LSGAIVVAAVLSALLTAIPLLLPAPDAAARRAEAAQVEVSEVSAALTALASDTADVGSAVRRAGGAAVAGQAHALQHRRELDGLGTGATRPGPAARRAATAVRRSADVLVRDTQETAEATRAAAAGVAGLQSSSTAIATWRADLKRRVTPDPAPWSDRLRVASGVMTVVTGVLAAWLAWRKLAPGGSGI
jgi:hypothetical protein